MTNALSFIRDRSADGLAFDARVRADAPGRQEPTAPRHRLSATEFARTVRDSGILARRSR